MSYDVPSDFALEAGLGNIGGYAGYNKFGRANDCDNGVATDVWDGADGTTSTDIWVPPTAARTHDIASTSAADAIAGTGAQVVRVYGLQTWASAESNEDVNMVSGGNAATANTYVVIYRMKVVQFGTGATNAGTITATAQTDATVTAAIQAGRGQTLMAIMACPSSKKLAINHIRVRVIGNASPEVEGTLLVDERADQSDSGFLTKDDFTFSQENGYSEPYDPPKVFAGPCLVKVQVTSDTVNTVCTASFDGYVVDD